MDQAADLLKARGLRNTAQRRAVLSALHGHAYSTAAELERRIGIGTAGPQEAAGPKETASPQETADPQETAGPQETAATRSPGGLSRQGLYNVLDDLTQAALVRCIEPAGSPTRYELRVGDNHHHLVCRSCGRIEDIDCSVGQAPCLDPADHKGFSIDEAEITWWGLCGSCRS